MAWTTHRRVVQVRRRHRLADVVVEVLDGWRRHLTGRNAAVMTYYGFLSIFPLFLVATTVLGIVLEDNEELQQDILDTAVAQIPVIGSQIANNAGTLDGGGVWTVVIGLLVALWASTKAFVGVQQAFDDAWEVPLDDRDNVAVRRGKALVGILIIGSSLVGSVVLTTLVSTGEFPILSRVLLLLGTITLNTVVLGAMYRVMTAADVSWRTVWPGAVLGALGFTLLQLLGVAIVERFLKNASDTAGAFGVVFALLAWLSLHATISLAGVELDAALQRLRTADATSATTATTATSVADGPGDDD